MRSLMPGLIIIWNWKLLLLARVVLGVFIGLVIPRVCMYGMVNRPPGSRLLSQLSTIPHVMHTS